MKIDRLLIALTLFACTAAANAGTVCVQNKQTGKYGPKNPGENPAACDYMNNQDEKASRPAPAQPTSAPTPATAQPASAATAHEAAPRAPVAQAAAPAAQAAAPVDLAQSVRSYKLKYSDVTVRLAVRRWLKEVGMQLAYEAPRDFEVPVEGDYVGTTSEVISKLMKSLSQSSYPLRACEYDNRVVLVVHRDEKCPLEE